MKASPRSHDSLYIGILVSACLLWLCLLWLCLAWSPAHAEPADAGEPASVEVRVKDATITTSFQLPEFMVFRASGELIYHKIGLNPQTFRPELDKALTESRPLFGGVPLEKILATLTQKDPKRSAVTADVTRGADFVFVEYWASWCAPCKHQELLTRTYLRANPKRRVVWLHAEKDPKKSAPARIPSRQEDLDIFKKKKS